MPLALSPNETFEIVLASDAAEPEASRPTFICRHLSGRDLRRIVAVQDDLDNAPSGGEALDRVFDALRMVVCGWRNMVRHSADEGGVCETIPYDPARLDELLTMGEAQELMARAIAGGRAPDGADLKNSASPSPSPAG